MKKYRVIFTESGQRTEHTVEAEMFELKEYGAVFVVGGECVAYYPHSVINQVILK